MKALTLLLACLLVAGTIAAPRTLAAKLGGDRRLVRRVEARYSSPAVGWRSPGPVVTRTCVDQQNSNPFDGLGCVVLTARPTEFLVGVKVEDKLGLPVPGAVNTESDFVQFCGRTTKPVSVEPGTEILVWVFATTGPGTGAPCAGTATQGVIKATFSNR